MTPTLFFNPVYFWLIAGLVLLLAELLTPGFVIACFGVGALLAILPAALGLSITWQVIIFCIGSLLALFLLRPMVRRLSKHKKSVATGIEALYGREAIVTETIDATRHTGRISVDGDSWKARCFDETHTIAIGEKVRIVGNESIVIIVEPFHPIVDNVH